MERDGIKRGVLRSSSLEVYSITDLMISNVLGDFFLIGFVDEDERVVFQIGCIIFNPIPARVICLFFLTVSD